MAPARVSLLLLAWLVPACFHDQGGTGGNAAASATATTTGAGTTGASTTGAVTTDGTTTGTTSTGAATTGPASTTGVDSASGPGTTTDPTTMDAGRCGDGVIDGGEQCDDGNDLDFDMCTNACTSAICGDGIVQVGVEQCDGDEDCSSDCLRTFLWVFVTSQTISGDVGGVDAADALCTQAAAEAGLSGWFVAWLSVDASSPADRLTHTDLPWRRLDGLTVADGWMDLVDSYLDSPISVTEVGEQLPEAPPCQCPVWTGTNHQGNYLNLNCFEWQTDAGFAVIGDCGDVAPEWSSGCAELQCSEQARLYCFEQPQAP